jgi:hypoxanthine-guanine phosphoribosyltransferase
MGTVVALGPSVDEFVVGYGIDYAQDNRHLPFIGKVAK